MAKAAAQKNKMQMCVNLSSFSSSSSFFDSFSFRFCFCFFVLQKIIGHSHIETWHEIKKEKDTTTTSKEDRRQGQGLFGRQALKDC